MRRGGGERINPVPNNDNNNNNNDGDITVWMRGDRVLSTSKHNHRQISPSLMGDTTDVPITWEGGDRKEAATGDKII